MAALALNSCETVPERTAGGGAYDDSYLAKQLDSNNPKVDVKDAPSAESYEQWREQE